MQYIYTGTLKPIITRYRMENGKQITIEKIADNQLKGIELSEATNIDALALKRAQKILGPDAGYWAKSIQCGTYYFCKDESEKDIGIGMIHEDKNGNLNSRNAAFTYVIPNERDNCIGRLTFVHKLLDTMEDNSLESITMVLVNSDFASFFKKLGFEKYVKGGSLDTKLNGRIFQIPDLEFDLRKDREELTNVLKRYLSTIAQKIE